MKAWLSRAGVAFTLRNVDEDLDAYDELMALGYRTVPVTVSGTRAVVGFRPDALEELTAARPDDPTRP